MKILVVTNYYPPHYVGGYELGCRDVVDRLIQRGHELQVLTGTYGRNQVPIAPEPHVHRILGLNPGPPGAPEVAPANALADCRSLAAAVRSFAPDVIYFWNQASLSFWLVECARVFATPIAFFLSDTCFTTWRTRAFLLRLPKRLRAWFEKSWLVRGRPVIEGMPCHFASRFLWDHARKEQIAFDENRSLVAHWGSDSAHFHPVGKRVSWPPSKLLYVGQLIPQKGVHTAIEALSILAKRPGFETFSLNIAGGSTDPDYLEKLKALPHQLGLQEKVHFLGKIDRSALAGIYREHDILVLPSIWEEPFAITPLEAMACEMAVVGTTTGGSGELLKDRDTAMVFKADDPHSCANALGELCSDRALFERVRQRGIEVVTSTLTLDKMVDQIEDALRKIPLN